MSNGVPMLCNRVGGADLVIENEVEGLVIDDCSPLHMEEAIRFACEMDDVKLRDMKTAAFKKAQQLFNLDNYIEPFSAFMNELSRGA